MRNTRYFIFEKKSLKKSSGNFKLITIKRSARDKLHCCHVERDILINPLETDDYCDNIHTVVGNIRSVLSIDSEVFASTFL